MSAYVNYMVEANLGLIIFLALYGLLLRNETQFSFKRAFLLCAIFASLLFPLVTIENQASVIPSLGKSISSFMLPEVVIIDGKPQTQPQSHNLSVWTIATWIYLSGMLFFSIRFLIQLHGLLQFTKNASFYKFKNRFKIIESSDAIPTFSFFNYIFLGNAHALTHDEKEKIIQHEIVHAQKFHSIDILIVEFLFILFWFNPFIRIFKNTLINIHEFQADKKAVENQDIHAYCSLLARVALQSAGFSLAHHFNQSLTVKRIAMMKAMKTKISPLKIGIFVLVIAGFFFIVACQDQVMNELSESTLSQTSEYPPEVVADLEKYKQKFPDGKFTYVEGESSQIRDLVKMQGQGQMILNTYAFESRGVTGVLLKDIGSLQNDEVFLVVEESAGFPGGMTAFYEFIKSNFQYPPEAKNKGIEGRVFIEFVVNKDGSISDTKVLKGIAPDCDEEALRILTSSPNWEPGKQRGKAIRQRMVLPISFTLSGASALPAQPKTINQNFKVVSFQKEQRDGKVFLTGKVEGEDGKPLPGMNVVVSGTTTGTVSNLDGTFSVPVEDKSGELVLSFVGYETKKLRF
jgi:TonB family protein